MKLEELEFKAIKFGRSEHKRSSIIDFYFDAVKSFKNLENININDNKKIYDELIKNEVLKKDKKKETNISREKTFFKNKFPIYKNINNKIKITKLSENILRSYKEKIFNGKNYLENALILFLIKEYPTDNIKENPFFYAINLAKTGIFSKEKFLKKIFKINEIKIKEDLKKNSLDDCIEKYFKFKSGNPNPKNNEELKKFQLKKNQLIKLMAKYSFYKVNEKEIIDYLYEFVIDYQNLKDKELISDFPKTFKKIFQFNKKYIFTFIEDFEKNDINKYLTFIKERINFDYLLENFYFENKKSDYINLINKYLFSTDFFIIENNFIKINKIYNNYILNLEKEYSEILKISLEKDNIIEKLKELNFKNNEINYISIRKIIFDYYNNSFFDSFFDIFLNSKNKKNDFNEKLMKLSLKNNHINGIVDPPTFFEFLINLFFFILFYKEEIFDTNSNYSDDYLTEEFKNCINTYLSSNLIPRRFASGGRSDGIFSKEKILIEPSLEVKNQIKHELNSILNHLKKSSFKCSAFIAPEIEDEFLIQSIAYNYEGLLILPINIKILKKIKDSNFSKELFNQIKNDFNNCKNYEQVSNIYNKYNFLNYENF